MDGRIKQGLGHVQVTRQERGEVERTQIGFRHGTALNARHPCAFGGCSNLATCEVTTRLGVTCACPVCAEIAFHGAAQPLSLEQFYEGEREHEYATA